METSRKSISKSIFVLGTFFSPFYFILPTNFSLYELLLLISFTIFLSDNNSIKLPDKKILTMLFFIFIGYTASIINAHQPLEALKYPLQFIFILLVQLTLIYNLVETRGDIYKHAVALVLSGMLIVLIITETIVSEQWEIGQRLETVFSINVLAVMSMMLFFTSLIYITTMLNNYRKQTEVVSIPLVWILLVGITSISLIFISLSTLSRRVIPSFLFGLALLLGTKFFLDLRPRMIFVRSLMSLVVIFAVTTILLRFGVLPDEILLRVIETIEGDRGVGRPELWLHGIITSIHLFPLGTGFNNFQPVAGEIIGATLDSSPHNIVLNPLGEGGVFAGVGMLGLIIIFSKRFLSTLLQKSIDPVVMSFPTATFCFFVAHIFGTAPTPRFFWLYIIFGLLVVSSDIEW